MENADEPLNITLAYAAGDRVYLLPLRLPDGATVMDAVRESGILERCPEIDLAVNKLGVFNRVTDGATQLRDGDRVEIYRPLLADPRAARRHRAARQKAG